MSVSSTTPEDAARSASVAARSLAILPVQARNDALTVIHHALASAKSSILEANAKDMEAAIQASRSGTLSQSLVKRLDLNRPGKYEDMLQGILDVRRLPDPLNNTTVRTLLDDNLELERASCPIGVLLIIFEARPEVIANIAALAIKSGNAAILKGGKESSHSFEAISGIISSAVESTEVPNQAIQLVKTRDVIDELLQLDKYIDLVIPRGGNELVRYVKEHTRIPVLGHADGLCSVYIHKDADLTIARRIVVDSKCDYPAACNAAETLLVHEDVLETILPRIAEDLLSRGVSLLCDKRSKASLLQTIPSSSRALLQDAEETDYDTEFLDLKMAIKTVPAVISNGTEHGILAAVADGSLDLAISHINAHSSSHTDSIITNNEQAAEYFMNAVDSAGVYWNASTRFADGMRYGFGTEVGISTNKIHSRGPVGLEGLTIYKYKIRGQGQIAGEYGVGKKAFKHEKLSV